ncbi:MAG: response regulator transcription factor [Bacteroidetes bacterium]|nr:MAG: response regulator transcription factor [Bacteroidota bacterium]
MLKLAIADDQNIMRNGLAQLIGDCPDIEIIQLAENGRKLIDQIQESKEIPHVVLMDIEMPGLNGFETTRILKKRYPKVQILFLTTHEGSSFVETAISQGGSGYLSKDEDIEIVIEAIREVHEKGYYFNENLSFKMIQEFLNSGKINPLRLKKNILSPKEIEFTTLLCQEKTDREIAELMGLSLNTALTYRKNIMKKIGTNKSIGIVIWAIKNKIFSV